MPLWQFADGAHQRPAGLRLQHEGEGQVGRVDAETLFGVLAETVVELGIGAADPREHQGQRRL
ncbi:hypothetical protein D3C87_2067790 [compost metagenome]